MSLEGGKTFLFSPCIMRPLQPLHLEMFPKIMAIRKGVSTLGLSTGECRDALGDALGLSTSEGRDALGDTLDLSTGEGRDLGDPCTVRLLRMSWY